jgi:transcription termination factor Rho
VSHTGDHDPLPPDELPPEEQARISAAAEAHGSDLQALEALSGTELLDLAHAEGLDVLPNLERGELIVQILQHRFSQRDLGQQAVGWHEGVLEILPDGFGFLRSVRNDYQPGPEDVYVSPSQVRRLNLKPGHQLAGPVRQPRRGEKYFALLHIERINGGSVMDLRARVPFTARTPILPHTRLRLDHPGASLRTRAIDLLAPWGKGQRALLAVPPGAGRTQLLQQLATALLHNHPDIHVAVCLVDERPEEVTALRRALAGPRSDVVASTFDEAPGRHLELAEMALARAQRWVEAGRDVVLLVDSLSAVPRAFRCRTALHAIRYLRNGERPPPDDCPAACSTRTHGSQTIAAARAQPRTEVDVFPVHEVAVVEAADRGAPPAAVRNSTHGAGQERRPPRARSSGPLVGRGAARGRAGTRPFGTNAGAAAFGPHRAVGMQHRRADRGDAVVVCSTATSGARKSGGRRRSLLSTSA